MSDPEGVTTPPRRLYELPIEDKDSLLGWLDHDQFTDWYRAWDDGSEYEVAERGVIVTPKDSAYPPLTVEQVRKRPSPTGKVEEHISVSFRQADPLGGYQLLWNITLSPTLHVTTDPRAHELNRLPEVVQAAIEGIDPPLPPSNMYIDVRLAKHVAVFNEAQAVIKFYGGLDTEVTSLYPWRHEDQDTGTSSDTEPSAE